ncbi:hypothetical protein DPSP01_003706 [Paraphaeosphaeria sporulosa]|uniref:Uncharacterized protein n=1 Tax=Paraphaeosphaeria sporulosa TaxID=1460663 RepID=A0A177CRR3_9PLEO|nr:uncharacterized protein CC84DRAFT_1137908 [Paraphaeosphaeria sporulosa]OAG09891.1 hypothetical protein CC84DRAFT_1137908 [Paraphaeosphaeria sporulosa]
MLSVPNESSSRKYHPPLSPASSHGKFSSAASSREALLTTSSNDIPLRKLIAAASSSKPSRPLHTSTSNLSLQSWPGHPRQPPQNQGRRINDHTIALSVTITLAILVLIGVPLGAILPQKYVVPLPINVLVPFYVYPDHNSWERMFQAAIKHPESNFTIILSVDHGPSASVWPPGIYLAPIKRLNMLPNVQAIGYVDTEYGSRDGEKVRKDIATYAGWNNTDLGISGIFFDHTPAEDVNDARIYLKNVSATVRHTEGFLEPTIVVHNPGKVPNANMTNYQADVTVVFEGEYKSMPPREETKAKLRDLGGRRQDYAEIIHSVPRTMSRGGIRKIINGERRYVGWLYVTDRMGDNKYEWYSDRWEEFLDLTF